MEYERNLFCIELDIIFRRLWSVFLKLREKDMYVIIVLDFLKGEYS